MQFIEHWNLGVMITVLPSKKPSPERINNLLRKSLTQLESKVQSLDLTYQTFLISKLQLGAAWEFSYANVKLLKNTTEILLLE